MFRLCRKEHVEGCSGCVGRVLLKDVFRMCRKGSVEGCSECVEREALHVVPVV